MASAADSRYPLPREGGCGEDAPSMHRIVFLERDSIRAKLRRPDFPHVWTEYPLTASEDLVPRLADATIAITNKVVLNAELLAQLPNL